MCTTKPMRSWSLPMTSCSGIYYQSTIDMSAMKKGELYKNLRKSYIIFFCTSDVFGKQLPIYTFENICLQDKKLHLGDEAVKIIVNPDSDRYGLSNEMNSFLDLLQGKNGLYGLAKEISDAIIEEKEIKRWGAEYMTLHMKLMEEREEGRAEGKAEGRAEGRAEGSSSANLDRLKSAMKNGPMTFEAACKLLDITKPDKYRNLIK